MWIESFARLAVLRAGLPVACGPPRSQDRSASGTRTVVQNKGSDALVNVAQNWAEAYSEVNPEIAVAVSGGGTGTGTGIAALINGTVDIANASRVMDAKEKDLATSRGRTPYDALAVYVHRSKDVVDLVQRTPCAIGYSGLAYQTSNVKTLCIRRDPESECIEPTVESAVGGSYVISRPLLMYTAAESSGPVNAYIDWVLSDEGQCILIGKGYASVRPVTCEQTRP